MLDPVLCFPAQERHGHNETSVVKDHRGDLKPEASEIQKAKRAGAV